MRTLILGYGGFIGKSIGEYALQAGQQIYGMSRRPIQVEDSNLVHLPGDRSNTRHVLQLVDKHKIDVIIDVIPMTLDDTRSLIAELEGKVSQYIMLSSADVYSNYELLHRKGNGVAVNHPVDELSKLRATRFPYRLAERRRVDDVEKYLDDYDKIPIEEAVQDLLTPWTILRLPMVYGEGDPQHRFRWAISPMLRGEESLLVPTTWANWHTTYSYVENVAAAIALAIGNELAHKQIFNIAEEATSSQLQWAKRLAKQMNWNGQISLTDDSTTSFAKRLSHLNLDVPFRVDGTKIRETLGYSEVVDEAAALKRTIEYESRVEK